MKYTGIIFQGWGVKAILEGRKTQTRRVAKWKGKAGLPPLMNEGEEGAWCPYGQVGDRLWVRETWAKADYDGHIIYKASVTDLTALRLNRWKPSIHMRRCDSRITLEITGVKVERIQDIPVGDCCAEGISVNYTDPMGIHSKSTDMIIAEFRNLWDSINAKRGYGWDVNPWDFALTFKVVK